MSVTGSTDATPVAEWVTEQGQVLLMLLEEHQYLVLALAVGIEAAGIPLPIAAEFVVVAMGFQIFRGMANPWAVIGTVIASATAGVVVLYWIARGAGRPLLERYGRLLRIRPHHLERLERWFARRAIPVVVIGRVVPAIRLIVPVVAGVARGDFRRFVISAAAGITLWTGLYVGLGWAFGETVEQVTSSVMSDPTVAFFAVVGAVGFVVAALVFRFRRRLAPLVVVPAVRVADLFTRRAETDPTP